MRETTFRGFRLRNLRDEHARLFRPTNDVKLPFLSVSTGGKKIRKKSAWSLSLSQTFVPLALASILSRNKSALPRRMNPPSSSVAFHSRGEITRRLVVKSE